MKEPTKMEENVENQYFEDPLLWEQAKVLLDQQTAYRKQLQEFLDTNPKTGLYRDELEELMLEQDQHSAPEPQNAERTAMFSSFVHYIQQQLSRSPRSLLRVSLDHTSATKSKEWPEICRLLFKDHETRQTFHKAGKRMSTISPGRCFLKLQHAKESLERCEGSSLSSSSSVLEQRVIETQRPPTADLDTFRRKVQQRLEQKRHNLCAKISSLTTDLQHDTEYQRYCHLTKLWKKSGAERIWNNFMHIDLSTCRRRGFRGSRFERINHKLIFAMIALQLQLPIEELTFQTNVYWWDNHKGTKNTTQAGEIDLVVLWRNKHKNLTTSPESVVVVAICELKNSCIDISAAFVQHQSKLVDSCYDIGPSLDCLYKSPSNPPPPLFVATNLPAWTSQNHNSHNNSNGNSNILGVEAAIVKAVCSGIRSQHLFFADTSDSICAPLVDLFEQKFTHTHEQETMTEQALAYIESLPPNNTCVPLEVDLPKLQSFIQNKIRKDRLVLSPCGCAHRYSSQILILPNNTND